MIVQHSDKSDQWGTPQDVIEAAREVMGSINFDPCSSAEANERVRAEAYSTDGLNTKQVWHGSVLMNPPGGRTKNPTENVFFSSAVSLPELFWRRLMIEANYMKSPSLGRGGEVGQAVVVGFTLEQLRMTQRAELSMLDFPFCVPAKRLKFFPLRGQKATSPAHSNVLVYVPGSENRTETFVKVFSQFGKVVVPCAR